MEFCTSPPSGPAEAWSNPWRRPPLLLEEPERLFGADRAVLHSGSSRQRISSRTRSGDLDRRQDPCCVPWDSGLRKVCQVSPAVLTVDAWCDHFVRCSRFVSLYFRRVCRKRSVHDLSGSNSDSTDICMLMSLEGQIETQRTKQLRDPSQILSPFSLCRLNPPLHCGLSDINSQVNARQHSSHAAATRPRPRRRAHFHRPSTSPRPAPHAACFYPGYGISRTCLPPFALATDQPWPC